MLFNQSDCVIYALIQLKLYPYSHLQVPFEEGHYECSHLAAEDVSE